MAIQRTTKQQILDAINDLHGAEQLVTREALQEVTGLKLTIIDDRVATLVDEGAVIRKGLAVSSCPRSSIRRPGRSARP